MKNMLIKVGWKKDFVEKSTPILPLSGWIGDNLLAKSTNMAWWSGMKILDPVDKSDCQIDCLLDFLNNYCKPPGRNETAPMRLPVSGIYKIKGVGDVLAGRVEQGLDKINMPRVGDVMIYKKDKTLDQCGQFNAQIQTLDIPGEIKVGYSPIGFVRCGRSACRATEFVFKVGKETGGKKMADPHSLKSNEMAEVVFRPQQPLVVDSFKNCEGLSRIAFLDGNTAVMLGKVVSLVYKKDMPPEETGKKKK